jgi:uncharacterized membrane protein YiaA
MKNNNAKHEGFNYPNARESVNILYVLTKGMATCVTPFIRCNTGVHALGVFGVIALIIIAMYASAESSPEMGFYLVAWFVSVLRHNVKARRAQRLGCGEHSQYAGWPWLAMKIPFVRTEDVAKGIEPFMCFFLGAFVCPLSLAMGQFLMLAGVGLLFTRMMELAAFETKVRRTRDAMIEMRQLSEELRRWR